MRIDVDEYQLDRGAIRPVLPAYRRNAIEQHFQPLGQAALAGADAAAGDITTVLAGTVDNAKAGGAQTGVDAEDTNGELLCPPLRNVQELAVLC